jgi:hypothetical protein
MRNQQTQAGRRQFANHEDIRILRPESVPLARAAV